MTNSFSKPAYGKDKGGYVAPKHDAPIPLYPKKTASADEKDDLKKIKLTLRRNPGQANSPTIKKTYIQFDGHTTEEYCQFREELEEIIRLTPLTTPTSRFSQMTSLITGEATTAWNDAVTGLGPGLINTNDGWNQALDAFALKYCSETARRDQKSFMRRALGKPQDMNIHDFWDRIRRMNRYMAYMPRSNNNNIFDSMELREMLADRLGDQAKRVLKFNTGFDYEDPNLPDKQVVDVFDRAIDIADHMRPNNYNQRRAHKKGTEAKTKKTDKPVCNYCSKKHKKVFTGHTDAECRTKKRDAQKGE
eukprot:scaffold5363_cov122-Cylindrotheca_fusiformis.AAC.1